MKISDNSQPKLLHNTTFLICLVVLVLAAVVGAFMISDHVSKSKELKEINSRFEQTKAEYKILADKNDPSKKDKLEPGNKNIKQSLQGIAEDEELDIRQNKAYIEREIASRIEMIESLKKQIAQDGSDNSTDPSSNPED